MVAVMVGTVEVVVVVVVVTRWGGECGLMSLREVSVTSKTQKNPRAIGNRGSGNLFVCLFVFFLVGWLLACLTSQQHANVSQGRICSDKFTCCHTEIEVAGQTFYLTRSQYTDTGPTSPGADPITPGSWQLNHESAQFLKHQCDSTRKKIPRKRESNPGSAAPESDVLTTRPTRRYSQGESRFKSGKGKRMSVKSHSPLCHLV